MEDSTMVKQTSIHDVPDELLQWDILSVLPANDLLRCSAVCRSWRRLTTDPEFLLARHRLQPSLPLVLFNNRYTSQVHGVVDAFDIRRTPGPGVRRPVLAFKDSTSVGGFTIHASCDGLLLVSLAKTRFYLCNPATRQWCELPDLTGCSVAALYPHRPSGEYRILYWKHYMYADSNIDRVYRVLTVSSSSSTTTTKRRCIGLPLPSSLSINNNAPSHWLTRGRWFNYWFIRACMHPPVLLHDCLHWHLGSSILDGSQIFDGKVVVFDTLAESFRLMENPIANISVHLLEMDGSLGISHIDHATSMAELWVLRDYEKEVWSLKYRIKLFAAETREHFPYRAPILSGEVVSENGDMLVTGHSCRYYDLFHCDSNGKLLQKYQWQGTVPKVLGLRFKESLIRHEFFQSKDGSRVGLPCFFQGL